MRLIIAEKPSLARAISAGFDGVAEKGNGYIKVGSTIITHCFGHMYELASPDKYSPDLKRWALETLPIVIGPDDWKLLPMDGAKDQIKLIARLLKEATEVVNAGDPDREGQMLVDELLEALGWKGPTQRILIYDTTKGGIRKALGALKPNAQFKPLYEAAKCRARADWLVGMNLTRAVSKMIGVTASIGRVQTPTLGLVVQRDKLIEGHSSSKFYTLLATTSTGTSTVVMVHDTEHDRIFDKALAVEIAKALKGQTVTVSVDEKKVTENAPLPYKLSTFQKDAEARFGWTAKKSLDSLQAAYEQQLVSYPRTDCPYLPEEQARLAVPVATQLIGRCAAFKHLAPVLKYMAPSDRVYNDKKVEEHFGLAPKSMPQEGGQVTDAVRAWQLVSEQFLKSLLPAYQALVKEASFSFQQRLFKATGETPLNADSSWRVMEPKRTREGEPVKPLPFSIPAGQSGPARIGDVAVKEGKTTPPKPYTEASLLADMSAVHKFVTDERIKALLKENAGIGTAATQSAIIETLKNRQFIETVKGGKGKAYLRSTALGRYVIEHVPKGLADPGITALWEDQLNGIAKESVKPQDFMVAIDRYVASNVNKIKATQFPTPPKMPEKSAAKPIKPATKRATKRATSRMPRAYA